MKNVRSPKFDKRYGVEEFQSYKCDPEVVEIPPKGHPLYDPDGNTTFDPLRVAEIDRDGVFVGTVLIWADKDANKIFAIDGRGNTLDLREVNRLRRERGDKEIPLKIMPLNVDLDRAVEHVRLRNFHRKRPTVSHTAREVVLLYRLGKAWARIAELLHLDTIDPEQFCRKLAPLAFCIPEVAAAVDSGEVSKSLARKCGGTALDGSKALGKKEQLALLEEARSGGGKAAPTVKSLTPKARNRAFVALTNGKTGHFSKEEKQVAEIAAAVIQREMGDEDALAEWPKVAAIFNEAAKKPEKGKKEAK